jgi:hypothetical protein
MELLEAVALYAFVRVVRAPAGACGSSGKSGWACVVRASVC